jgi:hypothetical protein
MNPRLTLALVCACAPCWAQTALAPDAAAAPATERSEPNVKHTVIEDDGSKIDELRVRGQVQRVTVTPKVGLTKPYEIIVGRGGRGSFDSAGNANGAVGKRVWNVLDF